MVSAKALPEGYTESWIICAETDSPYVSAATAQWQREGIFRACVEEDVRRRPNLCAVPCCIWVVNKCKFPSVSGHQHQRPLLFSNLLSHNNKNSMCLYIQRRILSFFFCLFSVLSPGWKKKKGKKKSSFSFLFLRYLCWCVIHSPDSETSLLVPRSRCSLWFLIRRSQWLQIPVQLI